MNNNYWKAGEWNVICDVCGSKVKSGQTKKRWDGFIVCPFCYEERHSMDFLRVKPDKQTVPFSRPRPADVDVSPTYAIETRTDIPSATPGNSTGI